MPRAQLWKGENTKMTLSKLRGLFYKTARVLGDVQAVRRGRIVKRIHNRIVGRLSSKILNRIWK